MNPTQTAEQKLQQNLRHLNYDILGFGILTGSTMAFIAVYASRLGASAFQVGLLTAGPAAVNLLLSMPIGKWLEGRALIRASWISALLQRLPLFLLVPLPLLFYPSLQLWIIILLALLMSIPGTVLTIAFNAMFADVIPAERRAEAVGRRNAIVALSICTTTLLSGVLLDQIDYPYNYQVVYAIGAVGALFSTYHLILVQPSEGQLEKRFRRPFQHFSLPILIRNGLHLRQVVGSRLLSSSKGKSLVRWDLITSPFGLFMFAYLAFYTVQYIPIPLFPLYFVNELHLTDGQISLSNALFYGTMLVASLQLKWLGLRLGHRKILVISGLLFLIYPLLIALAHDATLVYVAAFIQGMVWGMMSAALVNRLMERTPADDRPAHMALHNVMLNMGILAGSLLGPSMIAWMSIQDALFVSAGLRLLGGLVLFFWG